MELLDWIDKKINEIKQTLVYGKYFDSILPVEGINVYYLFNPGMGIDLIMRQDYSVKAIHFYSGTQKEVNLFSGSLPFNLKFSFSRDETRDIMGLPQESGGGTNSILYGITPFWDKYKRGNFFLHIQFSNDNKSIDLVTVSSLQE